MKLLLLAVLITLSTPFSFRNLDSSDSRWLQDFTIVIEEEALLEEEEASLNFLPDIQANPMLNDIFNFGLQGVIATGISRGRVPNTTFHPVSVSDWDEEAEENGELYTFTADAVSDDGNSVIDMTFNVHYNVITKEKRLGAYASKTTTTIVTTTPETPQIPVIPPIVVTPPVIIEEPSDEEAILVENNEETTLEVNLLPEIVAVQYLNDIFNFGVQNVIASGIKRGRIPNTIFNPVAVFDWSKKADKNGEMYTFSAIAVSKDGTSVVKTNFNVLYNPSTQEKTLRGYSTTTTTTTSTTRQGLNEEEVFLGENNEMML